MNYLNLSDRDILRMKEINSISEWFPNLRVLDIYDTKLNNLEEVNAFFCLLKTVEYLNCDLEVEEILY